ncbi:MAG: hypothetical protein D6712_18270 [Chloroflexi bacterium]|nr:MAG: hypothetical protein D6712_18270 [Chloroflexota bacterium]
MSELLQQLSKDIFPPTLIQQFVDWCIWEQARPALLLVLHKVQLNELAQVLEAAQDIGQLLTATEQVAQRIHEARKSTGPLGLSAAEAAAYEMQNILKSALDEGDDPESVAFFAARVCGWAAWAETNFTNPAQKPIAEAAARDAQIHKLENLIEQFRTD